MERGKAQVSALRDGDMIALAKRASNAEGLIGSEIMMVIDQASFDRAHDQAEGLRWSSPSMALRSTSGRGDRAGVVVLASCRARASGI